MSSTASFATASGWSIASRCATRAPRSCPARRKRSKPSARIAATWSFAISRFEYGTWRASVAGFARIAVAAQVRGHDGEALRQPRRHLVPDGVRLRIAVQQEQRGTGAAHDRVHRHAPGIEARDAKAGEKRFFLDHGAIMLPPGLWPALDAHQRRLPSLALKGRIAFMNARNDRHGTFPCRPRRPRRGRRHFRTRHRLRPRAARLRRRSARSGREARRRDRLGEARRRDVRDRPQQRARYHPAHRRADRGGGHGGRAACPRARSPTRASW